MSTVSWTIRTRVNETVVFDLPPTLHLDCFLGKGAYGFVCSAKDDETGETVAIKKLRHVFQSRTLAKRTLRELRILRLFHHPNIVLLRSIIRPTPDQSSFSSLYLIFEVMETDLYGIIRSDQPLSSQHVAYFSFQLLRAVAFLHANKIVHRDIKPRNLLVNSNCCLKLADFGMARLQSQAAVVVSSAQSPPAPAADLHGLSNATHAAHSHMTAYVTTRWYRAPEILMNFDDYGSEVDVWSCGCVMAELLLRKPLFMGEVRKAAFCSKSRVHRPASP